MPKPSVTVAATRALYIALGLTAIAVWALASFNFHSSLGLLYPIAIPVFMFSNSVNTEGWPRELFWTVVTAIVFTWVWIWAFIVLLLISYSGARASNSRS